MRSIVSTFMPESVMCALHYRYLEAWEHELRVPVLRYGYKR